MTLPQDLHPTAARLLETVARARPDLRDAALGLAARQGLALGEVLAGALGARLRLVELFAGVGGLGSGLARALGAVTILQAEADPARRRVLAARFPAALVLDNVARLLERPAPDDTDRLVVAGGFPCRGASRANLTGPRGMAHPGTGLWHVMAGVIARWRPRAVVFENVPPLRSRGLSQVLADLEAAGYDVLWGTLHAAQVGAPHARARLFGVARRRGVPDLRVPVAPPLPAWHPWDGPLPRNDAGAPGQRARVAALGDAVVPLVAWTVGRIAAAVLAGVWPVGGRPASPGDPPMNGALTAQGVVALPASPFLPLAAAPRRRFVTVDERFESPDLPLSSRVTPPLLGRVVYEGGDQVDVELPGGEVEPFPASWARPLWPTPTANDGRNRGARGQWVRESPGFNVLAQTDRCPREEWAQGEVLVDLYGGRGVGPGLTEWAMGFPPGWTREMAEEAGEEAPDQDVEDACRWA